MIYPNDEFFDVDGGMIMCGECINNWIKDTNEGRFRNDPENGYKASAVRGKTETPAQCDECLKQSDDYDDVLEND
jgi:hypothetical protein